MSLPSSTAPSPPSPLSSSSSFSDVGPSESTSSSEEDFAPELLLCRTAGADILPDLPRRVLLLVVVMISSTTPETKAGFQFPQFAAVSPHRSSHAFGGRPPRPPSTSAIASRLRRRFFVPKPFSVVPGSEPPLEPTEFDRDRERELALVVLPRRLIVRLYR